jgi:hypothetical protein
LRLGVRRIGSTPIGVFVRIALVVVVAKPVSLVLGNKSPEGKRSSKIREVLMNGKNTASSFLETIWAIGTNVVAGFTLPLT